MKKLLIIIALFIASVSTYATDTTTYVTNTNAEKLIDKYTAKVTATVIALAQVLKQPAEHVYAVMVKKQIISGISMLGFPLLLIICLMIISVNLKKSKWDENNWNTKATVIVVCMVFGVISLIATMLCFTDILQCLFNPEYNAIIEITNMIK